MKFDEKQYQSPFTWRYGSDEMRYIFSEKHKYELWRRIWVALAYTQHTVGLVSKQELADLKKHEADIDVARILEIEKETKHDVVAAIREFAEKTNVGGGKIHLGATSMDVVDNADSIRVNHAINLIETQLIALLKTFAQKAKQYADVPCLGYTHLQAAEPTTVGYRLAFTAQDLLTDLKCLRFVKGAIAAKGLKGAVGTGASYTNLLTGKKISLAKLEHLFAKQLGLQPVTIATQVAPRKFDYLVLSLLATISASCAKFASDVRILQSAHFAQWSEPFGKKQVGSSAMPFKRNPIRSEKVCSLTRFVTQLPPIALQNATHSYLERTLDDSANKRLIIPQGFLAADEILHTTATIIDGLVISTVGIEFALSQFGPFAATETILMAAVKNGANRQDMHEVLRSISLLAWGEIQKGKENPMPDLLIKEDKLTTYVSKQTIQQLLSVKKYIGDAPKRTRELVKTIEKIT